MLPKAQQKFPTVEVNGRKYILLEKFFYNSDDVIGEGAFGKVYQGFSARPEGKDLQVAIKTMELPDNFSILSDREKQTLDAIRKEILALKLLKHPNIIRLYDVKKQNNVIFMIMELCNEKSLNDYLKNHKDITELEIRYMFGQVLNGFKYLRSLGIIHRDVKPENILIRNSVLKIADFGFAKQHDSKAILHSYLGTRATIAPQVIMGQYTDKCDIWSLGATLYYMCFKKYPFKDFYASEIKLMELMKRDVIEFPKNGMQISQQLKQMIIQMLRFNEEDRVSWQDMFQSQLFQQKLLKEVGLNVFEYEQQTEAEESTEQIVMSDLDFALIEQSEQEIEQIQEQALLLIDQAAIQRKNSEIMSKLISRITFEKGKSNFLRLLAIRVHEYELTLSNKLIFEKSKVDISDHLKALRFGLNKYELIIIRGMMEWLKLNKEPEYYQCQNERNPLNVNENDWETFLDGTEKDKIYKALEKELNISTNYVYSVSQKVLIQVQSLNTRTFEKLNVNKEYLSDMFKSDQKFFQTLYDHCIGLARLLFPELVKIRNNLDQLHKVLSTLQLIDDLFILLTLESIFVHSDATPVNFNAFIESRKVNFSDDQAYYKTMYQRVMRTNEVFFE